MHLRHLVITGILALVIGLVALLWYPGAPRTVRPLLVPAPVADAPRLSIGPNVQVTSGVSPHMGCALATDPSDPRRLFVATTRGDTYDDVVGYYSHDAGATWTLSCTRPHLPTEQVADEDVAFGPDGALFFVNMRTPRTTAGAFTYGTPDVGFIDFARSLDAGVTWEERASISRYIDRPCLAVDCTPGPHRGRLYVHANVEHPVVLVSSDAAQTFGPAVDLAPTVRSTRPSNPVVLPDASIVVASAVFVTGSDMHAELPLWRSTDAGASWTRITPNLAGRWKHPRIKSASVFDVYYPRLAADPGSPHHSGRLYCVWRDGHSPDESYILFASSADSGATWSVPVIVSEQPAGRDPTPDYAADIPAIAVNSSGVVAVTWYDRRGFPKHVVGPNAVIPPAPGYEARVRISRDAGTTWEPSIRLNSAPIKADRLEARHWTGLAAAADGRFHAAWIGDPTGTRQVWTSVIDAQAPR